MVALDILAKTKKKNIFIHRKKLGAKGETIALKFLKSKGYKIIERNYKSPCGEIDIVAQDHDTLCFVEVKARSTHEFGEPHCAVTKAKQHRLSRIAMMYLASRMSFLPYCRFDVISVSFTTARKFEVDLIKDAFPLDAQYLL
jgi:putative endonuclease